MSNEKAATDPENASTAVQHVREKFRRLHAVLETHPLLSGLQTREHQRYLREAWENVLDCVDADAGDYPGGEKPDYSKEFDIEEDWT